VAAFYTIPPELPFLDTLVAGLLPRGGGDPLALTRTTILLPTRRAVRSLTEAFLRASAGRALLLPRLVPVGDLDAEDMPLSDDEGGLDLPPALTPLRRQLLLAQLVLKWGEGGGAGLLTPGQAVPLARALAGFLDEVQTARADMAALAQLAPDKFAEHWQLVLKFLGIVTTHWPRLLAAHGAFDPAERRNQVLAARIAAWERAPPPGPMIAAGLSGGIAAVADLIAAVARLPQGEIVLAGLDLDSASLDTVAADATHPQHLHARLLARFGLVPERIPGWTGAPAAIPPRRHLVRAALAPAGETDRWRGIAAGAPIGAHAIDGVRRLDCAGAQEEAELIALLMRQALENVTQTAALVTPDRALARRVAAELKRWRIEIDDSAGVPLDQTPPAVFLRLLLEAATADFAPLPLLALLKHPLAASGLAPEIFRGRVRRLERLCLRGPRPAPGLAGLRQALPPEDAALADLVTRLERALTPLTDVLAGPGGALTAIVTAHVAAAEQLAASRDQTGADRLWGEAAGETAAQFIAELMTAAGDFPAVAGGDYPALFEALMVGRVVRPRYGLHPRLAIWGLLEARLQRADVMILGGLNEGVWPPQIESDAFLSRPMRQAFGLPAPEERIGVAAHDFAQGLGARTVWLTRAARVEGTPTVPSRWLLRLETVLRAAGLAGWLTSSPEPFAWQRQLDTPPVAQWRRAEQPRPRPPVGDRPRRLAVTQIETLIRDPYSVYARHILGLRALEPIDAAPDAAARGNFIHAALDAFLRAFPDALPADAAARLIAIGAAEFAAFADRPALRTFWWPRFLRVAHWFIEAEIARRATLVHIRSEIEGQFVIAAPFADFTLTAKADRIDTLRAGGLAIVDYKTGTLPRTLEWQRGYAPQLPLEAAMAEAGGFPRIASPVMALEFWQLRGGEPPGEIRALAKDDAELRRLIDAALPGLRHLIAAYDDPATPYAAVPRAEYAPRYNDYAHLARVKEWAAADGGEEE